jgi:hypothetical protein
MFAAIILEHADDNRVRRLDQPAAIFFHFWPSQPKTAPGPYRLTGG